MPTKNQRSPASDTTLGRTFLVRRVLRPLALVLGITLGMKFLLLLIFIAILGHLLKQVSADDVKPRGSYGLRSPGYGKTLN